MHGTVDNVVPFDNGERLSRLFPNSFEPHWVEGAGHNDMEALDQAGMMAHTRKFLNHLGEARKAEVFAQQTEGGPYAGYQGAALPVM